MVREVEAAELCEYELARARRIEENRKRMEVVALINKAYQPQYHAWTFYYY
jgi:hypothetical protein